MNTPSALHSVSVSWHTTETDPGSEGPGELTDAVDAEDLLEVLHALARLDLE